MKLLGKIWVNYSKRNLVNNTWRPGEMSLSGLRLLKFRNHSSIWMALANLFNPFTLNFPICEMGKITEAISWSIRFNKAVVRINQNSIKWSSWNTVNITNISCNITTNWCFWTVVLEKTLESPLDCKEIQPGHPKGNQSWIFTERTDAEAETNTSATWCKELTHLKRPWCWERLRAGGEWDDRGWDGWMASPTQWTWVWVSSRSWWWTGRPGMLQSMGLQRVRHDWATELNWPEPASAFFEHFVLL